MAAKRYTPRPLRIEPVVPRGSSPVVGSDIEVKGPVLPGDPPEFAEQHGAVMRARGDYPADWPARESR